MMAVKDTPLNVALGPQAFANKDRARILPKQTTTVRRRVIFPTVKRGPLSSQQQYIQEPIKSDETVRPPIEVTVLEPMGVQQAKEEARQRLGALLTLSPLVARKPAVVEVKEVRNVPLRPPVASLVIPAMDTKKVFIPQTPTPKLPRRTILVRNLSMPEPGAASRGTRLINTPLVSILRTSKKCPSELSLLDTVGSVPSLVSLKDEGEDSSQSSVEASPTSFDEKHSSHLFRRSVSEPTRLYNKSISFDPRIWVREFERTQEEHESTWHSNEDMERFKRHALALIMARQQTDFIATGTGRMVGLPPQRPIFTHSALTLDGPDDAVEALRTEKYRCAVVQNEIRNILLVDPHDICLSLFTKAMKALLPLANVFIARSSQEALAHMSSGKRFDIILVEERLKLFHGQSNKNTKERCNSGSELIRTLISLGATGSLFVGVSAHLDRDQDALEHGGADLCWSKPPPLMDLGLRNHLLKSLLLKRGRARIAEELFG
jgi:CheY-like chemotaxis protein